MDKITQKRNVEDEYLFENGQECRAGRLLLIWNVWMPTEIARAVSPRVVFDSIVGTVTIDWWKNIRLGQLCLAQK